MTRIKLCGLSRICDIEAANELMPDYVGFVFARASKRYVAPVKANELREILTPEIKSVGVFVNEPPENILTLEFIDCIQLHGTEDENYIQLLRAHTDKTIIKAFRVQNLNDIHKANESSADYVLLDSGKGTGKIFDWQLIKGITREYFLAGGLNPGNVAEAIKTLNPFAVDVSSGIEVDGVKDKNNMREFVNTVRSVNDDKP